MTKLVRSAAFAAAVLVATSGQSFANESVEGQGELGGASALLYLVGGVAALGIVVFAIIKFMGSGGGAKK
jgi:hypothetical protein